MIRKEEYTFWSYQCEDILKKAALRFKYFVRAAAEGSEKYIKLETDRELLQLELEDIALGVFNDLLMRYSKGIEETVYIGLFPLSEDVHIQYKTALFLDSSLLSNIDKDIASLLVLRVCEVWAKSCGSAAFNVIHDNSEKKLIQIRSHVLALRTRLIHSNPIF